MSVRSVIAVFLGAVATAAVAAPASATIIQDTIWIHGYTDNGSSTKPVSNSDSNYGHFRDQIGVQQTWNTYGIKVDLVGDTYYFRIYTNKGSDAEDGISGIEIPFADFFIDLEPNNPITGADPLLGGAFSDWDLALDFQTGNLYRLSSRNDWKTSQDIFKGVDDVIYGGVFRAANCDGDAANDAGKTECSSVPLAPNGNGTNIRGFEAPTRVVTDAPGVEWLANIDIDIDSAVGDPVNQAYGWGAEHVISFSIAASYLNSTGFDVFWGTGECANDAIWGHVPGGTPRVPEPLSTSLFGLGLLGLVYGVRRRRRAA